MSSELRLRMQITWLERLAAAPIAPETNAGQRRKRSSGNMRIGTTRDAIKLSIATGMPYAFDNYPPDRSVRECLGAWPTTEDLHPMRWLRDKMTWLVIFAAIAATSSS